MPILAPSNIFAPGRNPPKAEIIQFLEMIQGTASNPAIVKSTKAALDAVTPANENYGGLVLNDPDGAKNGYYYRSSGSWVRGRGFPDTFAVLTSIGGTANAITASMGSGVSPGEVLCVLLPDPPGTNSSSTVTLTVSGTTYQVKAASGANLAVGDIIEGVGTLLFRVGSEWRQLFSSTTGATFDHQGDYAGGTTYTEGQVVTGSDGKWYQLKNPSSTGDDPVTSVTGAWLQVLVAAGVADGAVTTVKLAAGAATLAKIDDDAKADFRMVNPNGPRSVIRYFGPVDVAVHDAEFAMGGFRFQGQFKKARAKVFPGPQGPNIGRYGTLVGNAVGRHLVSYNDGSPQLGCETAMTPETWLAVFAVANDGDAEAQFRIMPFLRANHKTRKLAVENNLTTGSSGGWNGNTLRQLIPSASIASGAKGLEQVRFRLFAGANEPFRVNSMYVGIKAASGDAYDFASTPTPVTYRGQMDFVIPANSYIETDWIDQAIGASDDLLVSWYANGGTANDEMKFRNGVTGHTLYFKAGGGDDAATVNASGYTSDANRQFLIGRVEAGMRGMLLNAGGENKRSDLPQTRYMADNVLSGTDVLIINETLNDRANAFSGRLTTCTGNTSSQVFLADKGALAEYDYILPAPPGFDHYRYLGCFYHDTAEVRNFADSGCVVKGKMIYLTDQTYGGSIAMPGTRITTGGYISPLAMGIILDSSGLLSTATTGQVAEYFDMDGGNHVEVSTLFSKHSTTSESYLFTDIEVVFSFYPEFRLHTGGALASSRTSNQLNVTGWIEP